MASIEKDLTALFQQVMSEYEKVEPKVEQNYFEDMFASTKSVEVTMRNIILLFRHYAAKVDIMLKESRSS
jgi:hypothetical protein